jgi:hypothetical protein
VAEEKAMEDQTLIEEFARRTATPRRDHVARSRQRYQVFVLYEGEVPSEDNFLRANSSTSLEASYSALRYRRGREANPGQLGVGLLDAKTMEWVVGPYEELA